VEPGRDGEEGDDPDRQVEVEDPAPGQPLGERAAQKGAGDQRQGGDHPHHRLVLRALPGGHEIAHDGLHQGVQATRADALQGTEEDQHGHALGEARQE
jgi:hypothetical protein